MSKIVFDLYKFQNWLNDLIYIYDWDKHDRGYNLHRHYKILNDGTLISNDNGEGWETSEEIKGEIINE